MAGCGLGTLRPCGSRTSPGKESLKSHFSPLRSAKTNAPRGPSGAGGPTLRVPRASGFMFQERSPTSMVTLPISATVKESKSL